MPCNQRPILPFPPQKKIQILLVYRQEDFPPEGQPSGASFLCLNICIGRGWQGQSSPLIRCLLFRKNLERQTWSGLPLAVLKWVSLPGNKEIWPNCMVKYLVGKVMQ